MTYGSIIVGECADHLKVCEQCRLVEIEKARTQQPEVLRKTVDEALIGELCPYGQVIYRQFLQWLAS